MKIDAEKIVDEMITHQRKKLLQLAKRLVPEITPEDLRNPQDFPELRRDADFNFEDGILAGLLSVQMALRNR